MDHERAKAPIGARTRRKQEHESKRARSRNLAIYDSIRFDLIRFAAVCVSGRHSHYIGLTVGNDVAVLGVLCCIGRVVLVAKTIRSPACFVSNESVSQSVSQSVIGHQCILIRIRNNSSPEWATHER